MAAAKLSAVKAEVGLFAELIASVRVPEPLVVAEGLVLEAPTKEVAERLFLAQDDTEAQKVIFGDSYDAAMELFANAPVQVWSAFTSRYYEHFFGDSSLGK